MIGDHSYDIGRRREDVAADADDLSQKTSIAAPLPGTLLRVEVQPGESVAAGQALMVIESMKMEHTISAPAAVTVKEILREQGATVSQGERLMLFEPSEQQA